MKQFRNLIWPYVIFLFLLTVIPMLLIFLYSIVTTGTSITTFSFTLDNFKQFFDPVFLSVLFKSLLLGAITTIICLLIGYPIAYIITKFKESTQTFLILLVTFPTWINLLMRTYAWINLLSSKGVLASFLSAFGFNSSGLLYTDVAVVLVMVYNFLPFMILPIHSSLTKMDRSLVEASYDLGANKVKTFFKITFRLSLGGVLTGITMVFLPAISSFVIPKLIGGGQYSLIGNFVEKQFIQVGNWHFGSAVSLILAILVFFMMWVINRFNKESANKEVSKNEKN
ncbi:MAG: ABC transporter permease [Thomasclavelia sp.]|nr:ABC transporter permease [Thomasclavelia sp.]